jgi:hypothetical protein
MLRVVWFFVVRGRTKYVLSVAVNIVGRTIA